MRDNRTVLGKTQPMSAPTTSPGDALVAAMIDVIKAEAAVKGIQKGELAKLVEISPRTMTRYLSGEREMTLALAGRFAEELGLTLGELVHLAEQRLERD